MQEYYRDRFTAFRQGKYADAEKAFRAGLKKAEKSDSNVTVVALLLNNFADVYKAQSKYSKAEPLYKRSLAIKEKALGADRPAVAITLSNLAGLYVEQGKYDNLQRATSCMIRSSEMRDDDNCTRPVTMHFSIRIQEGAFVL